MGLSEYMIPEHGVLLNNIRLEHEGSDTGDMPKFSETQKLQNMLKQSHILS